MHRVSDEVDDVGRGDVAERISPGNQGADHGADGADHSHPLGEWNGLTGQKATELLLEIIVGGLMVGAVVELPEGVLVALMEDKEGPVGDNPFDEVVQQSGRPSGSPPCGESHGTGAPRRRRRTP